jgi:type I restriction enzyme S subunit
MKKDWLIRPLSNYVTPRPGNNKIIKGKQSDMPGYDLVQGYSASGPDVWVTAADYNQPGIVISAVGARCGKTFFAEGEWTAIANTQVLLPGKDIEPRWLWYRTNDEDFWIRGGTAQPFVKVRETLENPCLIPPLPEQQRIVALLDEAFAGLATAKASAERNLQNARALFENHLESVFSQRGEEWVKRSLEEIGRTQTGSTPKTSEHSNYGDFISFVKPGNFKADGTLEYGKDGLSETGAHGARIVPAGSVLMVCIGATIGKCGYSDRAVTTNQQVNALTPTDNSSHRFIYYQMLTKSFQKGVMNASGQATLPIINKSKWSLLTIWLPPTAAEQEAIADEFDALFVETQRLTHLYERKLAALEELKKSLLQQAFNGEL